MAENTPTVIVDNVKYEIASLSKAARTALTNLNAVDVELRNLRARQGIARVAREVFARQVREALAKAP